MTANTVPQPLGLSCDERSVAVSGFNQRFGEMERVVWCLSQHCRGPLLAGTASPVVEALVWTVKSWMGVQGVRTEAKRIIAEALTQHRWSVEDFEEHAEVTGAAEDYAFDAVTTLVKRSMALGLQRREFSLCSKILHWLLPWRVPVYDGFVRASLCIPGAWDHPEAYHEIVKKLTAASRALATEDCDWLGSIEPRSQLRGFDKCLWWVGGGSTSPAVVVRDPRRVVRELGLGS